MKLSLEIIRTFVVSVLIFVLGAIIQYRYDMVQALPFNLTGTSPVSHDTKSSTLVKLLNTSQPSDRSEVDFSAFWQAWDVLEAEYNEPEKLTTEKMVDGAIGGMVASLGDAYTMYLPPEDKIRSGQDLAGSFYGVGIELGYVDGILAVMAPLTGSPASQADVQAGDLILRVKDPAKNLDEDSSNWSLNKAVDVIRGPKNSPVTLTLLRRGKDQTAEVKPFEVTLQRQEIIVKSVELAFTEHAGKRVAHIKLSRFGERTDSEWREAVTAIQKDRDSIAGIVLDMRNNPGGFFDEAIKVSSDFIKSGVVVSQHGRFANQDYTSNGSGRLSGIPIIVVVNGGSASASEIVAGALRDRLQARLVGQKTFGKGTVQDRRELKNGGGIHVTIARWMLPGGEWIHEHGIPVDIEVEDNRDTTEDEQLLKAIEVL
jgi:carboxyl-terminal processing protease